MEDKMANGFYDEGWNARVAGNPYDQSKSIDWRDGWKDCDKAPLSARIFMD
jgi:hypothetical protein